jgi:hypothetical protein
VCPEKISLVVAMDAFRRAKQTILQNISAGIDFSPKGEPELCVLGN